jgi:hypothetical protein
VDEKTVKAALKEGGKKGTPFLCSTSVMFRNRRESGAHANDCVVHGSPARLVPKRNEYSNQCTRCKLVKRTRRC